MQLPHDERYERAAEYMEVVTELWDSWGDDATTDDRYSGRYIDPSKIRAINHAGRFFKVNGPLNVPRGPQGRPVLVQAGSSPAGRQFAARSAEAIFTAHQEKALALDFATDLRTRASALGRDTGQLLVLPGVSPTIGSTEAEARELERELNELSHPVVGLARLSNRFGGHDFSHLALDDVLSVSDFPEPSAVEAARSRAESIVTLVARERLTLRSLLHRLAGARGHLSIAGTPEQVADLMEDWFQYGAADGFNVMPPILPSQLNLFVSEVVPLLQKRKLFRTEYVGKTLRDHFGLERPSALFS